MIKENTTFNLKVFYVLSGTLSVYIHGEVSLPEHEAKDLLLVETLYQFYRLLKCCGTHSDAAKKTIRYLWNESEKSRLGQNSIFNQKLHKRPSTENVEEESQSYIIDPNINSSDLLFKKYDQFSLLDVFTKAEFENPNVFIVNLSKFPDIQSMPLEMKLEVFEMEKLKSSKYSYSSSNFQEINTVISSKVEFLIDVIQTGARVIPLIIKKYLGNMVRKMEEGDVFGERALEGKKIRTASIMCDTECE